MEEIRLLHGNSGYTLDAFNRLVAAYAAAGRHIDELHNFEPDETKRFFSLTLQGPNGHVYWNGGRRHFFRMNDDKVRKPVLWWWNHVYGVKPDRVRQVCGDESCISPYHAEIDRERGPKRIYPDHVIIGALQVWASRHGHPPTQRLWDQDCSPSSMVVKKRFGTWELALKAAGMEMKHRNRLRSDEDCIAAIHFVERLIGHMPSWNEFCQYHVELASADLPNSASTIRRHFGNWRDVQEAARRA